MKRFEPQAKLFEWALAKTNFLSQGLEEGVSIGNTFSIMKGALPFKLTAWLVLITFSTFSIAWAEEPAPIPCVAQLPPEGLRPVTKPNPFIGDKPNLPGPSSVPVTQTSLDFLAESQTLSTGELVTIEPSSPPDLQPIPPIEDKPFQFTGASNSISMTRNEGKKEEKEEKKEEEASSEKHPGITTGNLNDLVGNSTLIVDRPFPAEDLRPVVGPEFNIEFRKPFDQDPLPSPPVDLDLLEPPSLVQGEKVEIDVPLLEPPPLEKPFPLVERSKFSGNAAASLSFSKEAKKKHRHGRRRLRARERNKR